ncbi:hypothetical protein TNCV_4161691 [Trichonephila clavipes]|nr:hypothetical protein TNCV_4161691 [Trichonephila clavipes]
MDAIDFLHHEYPPLGPRSNPQTRTYKSRAKPTAPLSQLVESNIIGHLADLDDREQPLDVCCQKCTNLRSSYRRFEIDMNVSFTQWFYNPSYKVRGLYAGIECRHAKSGLFGESRHVYGNQNTARRTEAHLKRGHCPTTVSSFDFWPIRVAVSLYAALSKEVEAIAIVLTLHVATNAIIPYEQTPGCVLQTYPFPDCRSLMELYTCMTFSMPLSRSLIPY